MLFRSPPPSRPLLAVESVPLLNLSFSFSYPPPPVSSPSSYSLPSWALSLPPTYSPRLTASSGFTVLLGSTPVMIFTRRCTAGMRVEPPTRMTSSKACVLHVSLREGSVRIGREGRWGREESTEEGNDKGREGGMSFIEGREEVMCVI